MMIFFFFLNNDFRILENENLKWAKSKKQSVLSISYLYVFKPQNVELLNDNKLNCSKKNK